LESSFCPFDVLTPSPEEPLFVDLEFQTDCVITCKLSLEFVFGYRSLWELMNRPCNLFEKVSSPDDLPCFWGHIPYNWRILLRVFIELLLDALKLCGIGMQDVIILILEIVSK